jgi:hypothetical protein
MTIPTAGALTTANKRQALALPLRPRPSPSDARINPQRRNLSLSAPLPPVNDIETRFVAATLPHLISLSTPPLQVQLSPTTTKTEGVRTTTFHPSLLNAITTTIIAIRRPRPHLHGAQVAVEAPSLHALDIGQTLPTAPTPYKTNDYPTSEPCIPHPLPERHRQPEVSDSRTKHLGRRSSRETGTRTRVLIRQGLPLSFLKYHRRKLKNYVLMLYLYCTPVFRILFN